MISSNLIASEASSATMQGLTGKKGKGSSQAKGLFSNLLNILQKGKEQTGKKGIKALAHKASKTDVLVNAKKENISQALTTLKGKKSKLNQGATQPNILGKTPASAKNKFNKNISLAEVPLKNEAKGKHTLLDNLLKNKDGSDMIAVVQESTLIQQQQKKTVTPTGDNPMVNLTLGKKQTKQTPSSFSQQPTQGQNASNQQASTLLNNTDGEIQQLNPQHTTTSLNKTVQNTKTSETTTIFQPIVNVEDGKQQTKTPLTQDPQFIANQSQVTQTSKDIQGVGTSHEPSITKIEPNIEPNIAKNSPATDEDTQNKDATKVVQSPIAAPQRTANQNQALQNNASVINSNAATIGTAASDSNSASSQQDFGSQQSNADISLLEAGKTDSKSAKGLDFQAQLAYKSQRTFTPADTMLEIVHSAKTGKTSLELQLEPANLGKVQVSIQMDNAKHIQVVFTVDQNASRHALEQQMPQLRLALAQQGLDLGGFSMQMNQQGGGQQGQSESAKNTHADTNMNTASLTTNDEQQTRIGVNLATHGHLSILA